MKIAQVCPYNILRPGGVQIHVENLVKQLRAKGHEVKIIAPGTRKKISRRGYIFLGKCTEVTFNKTQFEISISIGKIRDPIKEVLKKENFDILHFHEPWVPALPLQLLYENKKASVATFHAATTNTLLSQSIETIMKPLAKTIVNSCDEIIAVSKAPAKYLKTFYKRKINIVPNGINLSRFRKKYNPIKEYDDGKINILFLGRLDERKGVIYLVKAFNMLVKKNDNVRLLIAGDGDEACKIKSYVKKRKIRNVEMLGFIEEKDKVRLYNTCDIFCSPALYGESFGMVLLEAMACGKPVVAYANEGYKCVLKGKGALLLSEPKDIAGLRNKLDLLCRDEKFRFEMGEWGLSEVKQYSWDNICDQVLTVYNKAIKRNKEISKGKENKRSILEKTEELLRKFNGSLKKIS